MATSVTDEASSHSDMAASVTPVAASVTTIEASVTAIETSFTPIAASVATIETSVTPIAVSIATIEASVTPIETSVTAIAASVTPIAASFTPIAVSIAIIEAFVTPIATSVTQGARGASLASGELAAWRSPACPGSESPGVLAWQARGAGWAWSQRALVSSPGLEVGREGSVQETPWRVREAPCEKQPGASNASCSGLLADSATSPLRTLARLVDELAPRDPRFARGRASPSRLSPCSSTSLSLPDRDGTSSSSGAPRSHPCE